MFAAEVLLKGRLMMASDPDAAAILSATLLGLYIQFNRDRKEVLDAYRS